MHRSSFIVRGSLALALCAMSPLACIAAADPGDGAAPEKSSKSARALGACGDVDYMGYCDGDTLVWCDNGLQQVDCAASGRSCGYESSSVGYNCMNGGSSPGGGGVALGFGYPVGDLTTYPAGGWTVSQVLGHYYEVYGGVHMAEDISAGEAATAKAPVHSVANGVVRYAGPNGSSYVNVVLIEHDLGNGQRICSFYGHLEYVTVSTGQTVSRGDKIAAVLDWVAYEGYANSHLHYVFLSPEMCDASAAASGALVCGYDTGTGYTGIETLADEPATWTSSYDVCGTQQYEGAFIAPSQFIQAHHF